MGKYYDVEKKIDSLIVDSILARGKKDWFLAAEDLEYDNHSLFEFRWKLLGLGPWQDNFYEYEDQLILKWIAENGTDNWMKASESLILRSTKQIYYRWKYLESLGKCTLSKNNKRVQKIVNKKFQAYEKESHNNFDRLLDKLSWTKSKKIKDLIDTSQISTVLDANQQDQLTNLASKIGVNLNSHSTVTTNQKNNILKQTERLQKKSTESVWTVFENQILFLAYKSIGPNWAEISTLFPNRFSKEIKNHFVEVLRTISMKFTKESLICIDSDQTSDREKSNGFSYKLREDQDLWTVWSDNELKDYVPLMFNLLNIDEKNIEKSMLENIEKLKQSLKISQNKFLSNKRKKYDFDK